MNKLNHYLALAAVLLAASASACATATVTFVNPEKMTDVPRFQSDRVSMEEQFREHFNKLAAELPAGQALKVDILDIDLAGEVFPRVAVQDVRVYKGIGDRPAIHLRYSIEQDGRVLRSGDRKLTDSNYMMSYNNYRNEIYGYEKQMLDDWFRKEIVPAH